MGTKKEFKRSRNKFKKKKKKGIGSFPSSHPKSYQTVFVKCRMNEPSRHCQLVCIFLLRSCRWFKETLLLLFSPAQSCPSLCDLMDLMPGFPVLHHLP